MVTQIFRGCKTLQTATTSVSFLGLVVRWRWTILAPRSLNTDKTWIRTNLTKTMFTWVVPRTWLMLSGRVMEIKWIKRHRAISQINLVVEIALQWGWNKQGITNHLWVGWHPKVFSNQIHLLTYQVIWHPTTTSHTYRHLNQHQKKVCI